MEVDQFPKPQQQADIQTAQPTFGYYLRMEQMAIVIGLLTRFRNETDSRETHKILEQILKELFDATRNQSR